QNGKDPSLHIRNTSARGLAISAIQSRNLRNESGSDLPPFPTANDSPIVQRPSSESNNILRLGMRSIRRELRRRGQRTLRAYNPKCARLLALPPATRQLLS